MPAACPRSNGCAACSSRAPLHHLWYLPAALLAVPAAFFLRKLRPWLGFALAGVLYLIGLGGDSWQRRGLPRACGRSVLRRPARRANPHPRADGAAVSAARRTASPRTRRPPRANRPSHRALRRLLRRVAGHHGCRGALAPRARRPAPRQHDPRASPVRRVFVPDAPEPERRALPRGERDVHGRLHPAPVVHCAGARLCKAHGHAGGLDRQQPRPLPADRRAEPGALRRMDGRPSPAAPQRTARIASALRIERRGIPGRNPARSLRARPARRRPAFACPAQLYPFPARPAARGAKST